eukprot:3497402-Amphidinium_carterae.1
MRWNCMERAFTAAVLKSAQAFEMYVALNSDFASALPREGYGKKTTAITFHHRYWLLFTMNSSNYRYCHHLALNRLELLLLSYRPFVLKDMGEDIEEFE